MSLQGKTRQEMPMDDRDIIRDPSFHLVIEILKEKPAEGPSVIERFNKIFAGTGIYMDYR